LEVVGCGVTGGEADNAVPTPARRSTLRLALVIDNVRSAFNVGSMFRSADAAGVGHIYLCGITPTPAHSRVSRTALGAEESVVWSQHRNALRLAISLQDQGVRLWALEEGPNASPLQTVTLPTAEVAPAGIALVAGNELTGVDPGVMAMCELKLCLPMRGRKRSLNVAVAAGVALNWLALPS
jgi:tRNA G18 (ribose-2'-O)-methylase SpoU